MSIQPQPQLTPTQLQQLSTIIQLINKNATSSIDTDKYNKLQERITQLQYSLSSNIDICCCEHAHHIDISHHANNNSINNSIVPIIGNISLNSRQSSSHTHTSSKTSSTNHTSRTTSTLNNANKSHSHDVHTSIQSITRNHTNDTFVANLSPYWQRYAKKKYVILTT